MVILVVCVIAIGYGIALLKGRGRGTQVIGTVVALLLILTWLPGIVAVIAVPILLWAPQDSRNWFGSNP